MTNNTVESMFVAVFVNRATLYAACAMAVLVPAKLHRLLLRLASGPLLLPAMIVVRAAPRAVERLQRLMLVGAEGAQALSALLVACELLRVVAVAFFGRGAALRDELCRTSGRIGSDALLGNPLIASRVMAALVLCIVALHADRVLRLITDREARAAAAALDCAVLVFLVCEQSPLTPVFALHTCLDSALSRTSLLLITIDKRAFAVATGNLRAVVGVVLSTALMLLGARSFEPQCRGHTLDAAVVVCTRLNTALWDLVDVAKRTRAAAKQA